MYHMLNDAGTMTAHMLSYRCSLVIKRKVGMSPPLKYIGISRNILHTLRPISLGEVSGYAHSAQVIIISTVGTIVYIIVFLYAPHMVVSLNRR